MTYTANPADDSLGAESRDIPTIARRYTCDMAGSSGVKIFQLPVDIKVATIINNTDVAVNFYPALYDGSTYTPLSDLHTAGTSSKIDQIASGATFSLAQNTEFNTLIFKGASAATGLLWVRVGSGPANGLADIEVRAITAA